MAEKPLFERVALIGIGLIGSSIAHVIRRERLAGHISGHAQSQRTRDKAVELKLVDSIYDTAAAAVQDADLAIVCTPIGTYAAIGAAIAGYLKTGAIVTDVGSVKQAVIRDLGPLLPDHVHFIPGHPIAGTEHSGPESGFAELFRGRWTVLTPPPGTDETAVEKLAEFWRRAGSQVEVMEAGHHDKVLAITSHLPHLIAYCIVGTVTDLEEVTKSEVIKFSASGFRDFTRIAASDPTMWRDIFLNNREAVLEMLGRFNEDLAALQRAVRWGDGDALFNLFTRTRAIRRSIIQAGQDTAAPDFGRSPPGTTKS
jgi:cyclohexadieny/prephenate dehydrogenase